MGTSTSSSGPASNIPMDPPWLDDINAGSGGIPNIDTESDGESTVEQQAPETTKPEELAPRARFKMARQNLGEFAQTGSRESFKKAAGYYSKKGMGGASNVAKRMKPSANAISGLVSFLRDVQNNATEQLQQWVKDLMSQEPSVEEVADAIIERVTSEGGMIDEESIKNSMANALSDLYEQNPEIDFLNLNDDETWNLVENFLAYEASHRIQLDIGQLLEGEKLSPKEMVERTEEMYDYLRAEISAQIQPYKTAINHPDINKLNSIIQQAIESTFLVFEETVE